MNVRAFWYTFPGTSGCSSVATHIPNRQIVAEAFIDEVNLVLPAAAPSPLGNDNAPQGILFAGVRDAEMVMVASHGSTNASASTPFYQSRVTIPEDQDCTWTDRDLLSELQALGNTGHLRWLILETCDAIDLAIAPQPWGETLEWLRGIYGFSGLATDGWPSKNRGRKLGHELRIGTPLAAAWLAAAFVDDYDDTPVALASGASADEARSLLDGDRLVNTPDVARTASTVRVWRWRSPL